MRGITVLLLSVVIVGDSRLLRRTGARHEQIRYGPDLGNPQADE
jgi:hypothetical protein